MSYLTEINCKTILEAIKAEKQKQKQTETEAENDEYVNVNATVNPFWTDLFANCFLCLHENGSDQPDQSDPLQSNKVKNTLTYDDLLFFVSKIDSEDKKIECYRRESQKLPCLTDLNYDWEETVYLNLILHQFEYILTCAICTQTGAKDLEILKRHSKRVYASPSKRDLQSKGTEEVITYPNIYFMVDDFDDAFNEMIVKENEMVCVELLANDGNIKKVLFLGSIKYEALKKVYDARASTGSKLVQKMTLGNFTQKRVEFVKMRGPAGKGYAEMAVSRHYTTTTPSTSQASTPLNDSFDPFQGILKFSNTIRKKSSTSNVSSLAGTPEVEAHDFRQEMIDNSNASSSSFWGRTFGALTTTLLNKSGTAANRSSESSPSAPGSSLSAASSPMSAMPSASGIPLNAYLTYVTLKLNSIMNDVLETRQRSLLTF